MKQLFIAIVCFVATTTFAQKKETETKFADMITPQALKEKLSIIASPEMEGRETATPGQKHAAAFIEEQFKKFGLLPGNGDSYQQKFPVYQDEISDKILQAGEKNFQVNEKSFEWDKDYTTNSAGNWTLNNVVFAGEGNYDSAKNINDFAGLDVNGKAILIVENLAGTNNRRAAMMAMRSKIMAAQQNGAAGIFAVSQDFPLKNPTPLKGAMTLRQPKTPATTSPFFYIRISNEVASALLGKTSTLSFDELKNIDKGNYSSNIKITVEKNTNTLESSNVIGVLPGTDKKDEYVFLTAHYDHLGKRGNVIYYGADDDGSGTASILQMAQAFTEAAKQGYKPRRTIVFMTVSGEEKGLLGSEYYSEHPIYSLDKTSVDLNTDMDGRIDTERKLDDTLNYIYVIGHDKLSSDLPKINEGVNNKYTHLTLDYKFDDPNDPERIYYRSDHYNFAKKGVPVLFFYDGMLKADYHQPSDTVDKINFDLMSKRVKMIFYTAWEMANRDEMLKRDTPLNMPASRF